jgi:hypothetical protein
MKKIFHATVIFIINLQVSFSQDIWTQKANLFAVARFFAAGFGIGTKGYVGSGYNPQCNGNFSGFQRDFYEWDQATNAWTQKAFLPLGNERKGAVGFSIGTKGYICTGFDGANYLNDLWEYSP